MDDPNYAKNREIQFADLINAANPGGDYVRGVLLLSCWIIYDRFAYSILFVSLAAIELINLG
jgi:hypothetical protein